MSDKDLTEIVCVIDRSGSMRTMCAEAIGGFNHFLEEQKRLPGKAQLTLVQFDHLYEVMHASKPISDVPPLNSNTYVPRGTTALLDAVGRTVDDVGARLSGLPEAQRPSKIIILIITDGCENASHDYSAQRVREMITHQRETYSWEFVFLGANVDAFAEAAKLGIQHAATYAASGPGTSQAYAGVSRATSSLRSSGKVDADWSAGIDSNAKPPVVRGPSGPFRRGSSRK